MTTRANRPDGKPLPPRRRRVTPRVERIGDATLYLGDCREIVPTLPRPAALISDPPYGQRLKVTVHNRTGGGKGFVSIKDYAPIAGDDAPFDPAPWLAAADIVLLWGAHKFADRLPPGQFLVWDKLPNGKVKAQGCGEVAWVNSTRPLRIFRLIWDGLCIGREARHERAEGCRRLHPAQKPVALLAWAIQQAHVPAGGVICDPYMGAGATGIASAEMGHPFIGCEIELRHFDIACRRIEAAVRAAERVEAA